MNTKYTIFVLVFLFSYFSFGINKVNACLGVGINSDNGVACAGGVCSNGTCVPKSATTDVTNITNAANGITPANNGPVVQQPAPSGGVVEFTNPLRFTTVEDFLSNILSVIQKIIVSLALVFIVIGAVMILTSAGNSGMVEQGKKAITMALIGVAIGVAAPSILKELASAIGWGGPTTPEVYAALTLSQIALKVLNFLLGITGVLALIMLVIGGITYLTSAGDEDRVKSGKEIFKFSLIGIVIVMLSMIVVQQIALFFVSSGQAPSSSSTTATADACSSKNPGFICMEKATSSNQGKCVTGLCPGASSFQCCPK